MSHNDAFAENVPADGPATLSETARLYATTQNAAGAVEYSDEVIRTKNHGQQNRNDGFMTIVLWS